MGTIQDRGYVRARGSALIPTWLAFAVTRLLEEHFGSLVDYDFTASMEEDLDRIANGDEERARWLARFYFGDEGRTQEGLRRLVEDLGEIDAREISTIPIGDGVVVRVGRYGPYVEELAGVDLTTGEVADGASGTPRRATITDDVAPDEMTPEKARELLEQSSDDGRVLGQDPESGREIVARAGRYGPYVTEVLDEETAALKGKAKVKPRTASLFKDMDLATIDLDAALKLLSLPRVVGTTTEEDGTEVEITAQNGRYGPYLKKGTDSRSLATEQQLFDITLEEALAIYAQPKQRGRGASTAPLKELGNDPVSGKPMVVKDGRFGPYVTDGETNATLRKGDEPEALTPERGAELLAEKRAKGPTTRKRATKKAATKKTAAKKTTAKKATAKRAAKKA
jgi:DNA topoisomerase-1